MCADVLLGSPKQDGLRNTTGHGRQNLIIFQQVRLYQKGAFIGFSSSLSKQRPLQALIKVEGVNCKEDTQFYLGKRVAFIYKAKRKTQKTRGRETNYRCIWVSFDLPWTFCRHRVAFVVL